MVVVSIFLLYLHHNILTQAANAHSTLGFSPITQYWTSRGYAFVAVNYAGSTGYGRAYRQSLNGLWGLADGIDAASCVDFLSAAGEIDISRVGIVGQSSGGYTVLQAAIHHPTVWAGGISRYGIGNLHALAEKSHKYESHYGYSLILAGKTKEEIREVREERSPFCNAEKIKIPILLLQGSVDKVVPRVQAEEMYEVMKKNGIDTKLILFEGEGHGWKMKKNIKRGIEEEEAWWRKTLVRG
jgi:dipeptidyl aminopeptidase/acylaminoacyl peptidase